jgi:hypothetical protein
MRNVPVGIFDMHAMAGLGEVEGFISLSCFRTRPVTVDYSAGLLILEDQASLARRIAGNTGIDLEDQRIQTVKASDETGHEFVRYFTELRGDVKVSRAHTIRVTDPQVMFQKIIYDGLVGDRFLRNFTTTYDLAAARMIFALPG